ncbi:unnamed protein product [Coffea canephora]|uniref:Uncharacterized protein n=1 Tax=Coffea canephora TaxID=49390 RepID=A0A068UV87_COFCA|nr:unnamed protein product [Coffea canephora]
MREGSGACEQFFHLLLTLLARLEFAAGEMLKKKEEVPWSSSMKPSTIPPLFSKHVHSDILVSRLM